MRGDALIDRRLHLLALSDVAFAMVGNLGRIAEVQVGGQDAARDGNYLYGAFGGDFPTSDGRRSSRATSPNSRRARCWSRRARLWRRA